LTLACPFYFLPALHMATPCDDGIIYRDLTRIGDWGTAAERFVIRRGNGLVWYDRQVADKYDGRLEPDGTPNMQDDADWYIISLHQCLSPWSTLNFHARIGELSLLHF
jgi:hypothetical protein